MAEVEELRVEVDGRAIVDGVSLRLLPGRITALVGASGSGKTTTGRALLGEYPETARVTGRVRGPGRGLVGYVPQHPAAVLNPARRVGALLLDLARARTTEVPRRARRAAARERVLGALALAQLPDGAELVRRHPHQLSGGQQQRVVIAQALLSGAPLVVADEPTTGQDALTKRRVVAELAALADRGIAVLLLSHDLEAVRELADDVLVMKDGHVVESGPAERLWRAPRHAWTRALLSAAARPEPAAAIGPDAPVRRGPAEPAGLDALVGPERVEPAGSDAPVPPGPAEPAGLDDPARPESAAPAGSDAPVPPGSVDPAGLDHPARPESAAPLLRVRSLTARHGSAVVLRDAGLSVRAGECLAVVGRSGSGKTTLARCVAGLHREYAGEVLLDGVALPRSLRDRSRDQLAAVQYVFQDAHAAFDGHRAVLDQVARTAVRLRGLGAAEATAEALETLRGMGLAEELVRRRPDALSGGELQRAALARALLARPRVLICDEVTSGLDPVTRRDVLDLLAALPRERRGMALLLITHDLDAAALGGRVVVLDGGEVVESGPTREVLAAPRHPFTAALVTAAGPAQSARSRCPMPG
ncbi:peptide ABC transporter ATP-binding protein [Streptomyces sp. SAJ15]|nr:peptide ABC transporter ATP-binding protein [Streptomyces sp. SAJ15]